MKELIEFSEFLELSAKLEIKVGKITEVEDVPKSSKLIKLTVDFGTETRIVVTNIKPLINECKSVPLGLGISRSLVDKSFAFITNLKPVTMMGIESTAMIMPGEVELGKLAVIRATTEPGTKLL
jgi:methionyl-tRNA synthetase